MSNLNIQQKVNLLAQKNRDIKTKERDLTDPASKRALYEEEIKPNLSENEQATINKYLERLAPLKSYKEPEVYNIIKSYDWNEKVLDGIVASMLKKMEDAGNFEGWTEVKQPQKAQPQKAAGKDSKEFRENKGNKKFAKDGSNKRENDAKKGVEGEEQKAYKKRDNAESGKREYNEGGEQQEDYYGNNYYGRGNRGGKRQYKQRDNAQQDVYYVKRGKSKQQQEHVEYVKKGDKKETEQQQETTGVREQVVYEVRAPAQETQQERPKTVAQDKPTRPPVEEERPVQTQQTSTGPKENTSIPHEESKAVQRPVAQDRTSERANKPIIQPQEQPTVSQSPAKPIVQPEVSQPPVKKPEPVQQTAPTATTTTAAPQQVHNVPHTQQQQQQQQHSPAPEVGTQQQPQVQGGFPAGGIALKETHPILPFPYIVFPQPNGTCIIQPLPQMMMPQMMPQMVPTPTQEKDPRAGFQQYPVMPGGYLPVSHDKPRQQQQQSGNSYLSFPGSEGQHQSQQVNAGSQYPFMPMMFPGSVPVINYGMQQQQQFPTKQGDSASGHHMNPFFQQH